VSIGKENNIKSILPAGTILYGIAKENKEMVLELVEDLGSYFKPEVIESKVRILNEGKGLHAKFFSQFMDKIYSPKDIISKVQSEYRNDVSLTFNGAFFEEREDDSEKYFGKDLRFFDEFQEFFLEVGQMFNSPLDYSENILIYSLIYGIVEWDKKGYKEDLQEVLNSVLTTRKIPPNYSKEKQQLILFLYDIIFINHHVEIFDYLFKGKEIILDASKVFYKDVQDTLLYNFYQNVHHSRVRGRGNTHDVYAFILNKLVGHGTTEGLLYEPYSSFKPVLINKWNEESKSLPLNYLPKPYSDINSKIPPKWRGQIKSLPIDDLSKCSMELFHRLNGNDSSSYSSLPPIGGHIFDKSKIQLNGELADVIISNPPVPIKKTEDFNSLFDSIISSLKAKGKAYILLPTVYFKKKEFLSFKYFNRSYLKSIIELPNIMDGYTNISMSILVFDKSKTNNDILFASLYDFKLSSQIGGQDYVDFLKELDDLSRTLSGGIQESEFHKWIKEEDLPDTRSKLLPGFYCFKGAKKLSAIIQDTRLVTIGSLVSKAVTGNIPNTIKSRHKQLTRVITAREISSIHEKTYNASKGNINFEEVEQTRILNDLDVIIPQFNPTNAKELTKGSQVKNFALGRNLIGIKLDKTKISTKDFLAQLNTELFHLQLKKARTGKSFRNQLATDEFLSIRIELPVLDGQDNLSDEDNDHKLPDSLLSLKGLEHYINNQYGPAETHLSLIEGYLNRLDETKTISLDEPIGASGDTTLRSSFSKVGAFVEDVKQLANNLNKLYKLNSDLTFEKKNLKSLLRKISNDYREGFKVDIVGDDAILDVNKFCLSIIIENLFSNFLKHGVKDNSKAKVQFELKRYEDEVVMLYRNNGAPFPEEFSFDDFLNSSKASGVNAGSGMGGELISLAAEKSNIHIDPINVHGSFNDEWNVIVKFTFKRMKL